MIIIIMTIIIKRFQVMMIIIIYVIITTIIIITDIYISNQIINNNFTKKALFLIMTSKITKYICFSKKFIPIIHNIISFYGAIGIFFLKKVYTNIIFNS